jgi:3-oxoacyl-[acyl-carrier-protein] synthase-3
MTDIAFLASQEALKNSGIKPEELDLIIVATVTADTITPSSACLLQDRLGAKNAICFDINAACSGFLFAMSTAHMYLQGGMAGTALVVGAEVLSKIMDWSDRSTCVLFGDGAGAAVLGKGEHGIRNFVMGSDGSRGKSLICSGRPLKNLFTKQETEFPYVHMDGQEVFRFAVRQVPECIEALLEKASLEADEVKYFVLHQANIRIIQSVAKRLRVDIEKFPINLSECGNTSAASIPILLAALDRDGKLRHGDKLVLSGFGGGLTWGAVLIEW